MCSTQFEFLDLSNIKEEDYQELVDILEEKTEICLSSGDTSPAKDIKDEEEEEEEEENEKKILSEDEDFISQSNRDESASGITFFFDGGTADDIDPNKTPPILSSSETPPPSESPSTLCNDQDEIPAEESMEMYPPPHTPQSPYINQPPPMVPPLNVHGIPTSGTPLYNIPPPYTPHSTPGGIHNGGMYPIPPNHAHSHLVPHTVHIENCHVNLSPYGSAQPPGSMYTSQPPHPQYQGSPHPQVFQQFLLADQPPMSMSVKPTSDMEHDYKRHDVHGRGTYRGRGRGRGRRRGRDDHERSNSVSSDHSSYSDSGSKGHYKDNGPPQPVPPSHYPLMPYPHYVPYQVNHLRPHQGFPLMPSHQFIPNPYPPDPSHVLAYSAQPPASVALVSNENSNQLSRHSECIPIMMAPNSVPQVSSMSSHSTYIVTSGYDNTPHYDASQYSYCSIDENNVDINLQTIPSPSTVDQQIYTQNNVVQNSSCSNDEVPVVLVKDDIEEEESVKYDPQIDDLEKGISSIKIEQNDKTTLSSSVLQPSKTENSEIESKELINNVLPSVTKDECNSELNDSSVNVVINQSSEKSVQLVSNEKNVKSQNKSQSKLQNYSQKPQNIDTPVGNVSIDNDPNSAVSSQSKCSPVPSNNIKKKENGTSSKSKNRKNSPQNKDNNSVSLPALVPTPRVNDNVINFVPNTPSNDKNKSQLPPIQQQPKVNQSNNVSEDSRKSEAKKSQSPPPLEVNNSTSPHFEIEDKANLSEVTSPTENHSFENSNSKMTLEPQNSSIISPTKPIEVAWGQKMSWSQLFKSNDEFPVKQIAFVSPFNAKEVSETNGSKEPSNNENDGINFSDSEAEKAKVGTSLKNYVPDYRPVLVQPRGLINKNYWCYVNAPLQALLACPSFYQLAKSLSKEAGYQSGNTSTHFINSIVDFVSEFTPMSAGVKQTRKEKNANKKEPEVVPGTPFEPTCVYKMLCNYKKDQFAEGRQQDAEEMLSCVLNGLHDEMVESLKLAGGSETTPNGVAVGDRNGSENNVSEDETEWKVQGKYQGPSDSSAVSEGPKKKSYVTRTAHFNPSPISQIFWGQLRSVLQQAGGNTTANLQPFNTLPLDIQSSKVDTLKDALGQLVTREEITGFTCPKTNQEVTASNQLMFEDLPRVLILQLKRFIYDNGGLQKVTKRLQFPIDLDITKDLISTNSRGKFSSSQRRYKLFAVVNHEGKEATKGHYVADIFHNGYNCWLRYDDSSVKPIPESVVLRHDPPRVPYLLFYRRSDTLASPVNGNSGNNSNSNGKAPK